MRKRSASAVSCDRRKRPRLPTAFQYSTLVFAAASYNAEVFDTVQHLLSEIKNHSLANRTVGLIENGSWVPTAKLLMEKQISTWKNTVILEPKVTVKSAVKEDSLAELEKLADALYKNIQWYFWWDKKIKF